MTIFGDFTKADAFDALDGRMREAGSWYLIEMAEVIADAGLAVVEVDGWQWRARGSGGYTGSCPWCVMWHHTASQTSAENDVAYIVSGHEDSPIANLYLARDGAVWVCAGGATNTNGKGGPLTMSRGVVPVDQMNTHAVSIEMANSGLGEVWPRVQIDAAFTLSLALAEWLGLEPTDVATHTEWAPGRKIDPATADAVEGPWQPSPINSSGSWSVDDLRAELLARATAPPPDPVPPEPLPPKEDDMPNTFVAAADGYATLLVSIDGAGTSVLGFATEADREAICAAIGDPPIVHVSAGQMVELASRAAQGDES